MKPATAIPTSFGLPFIGHVISALAKQELFYFEQWQKHGSIFRIHLPLYGNFACLIGPEANALVLKDAAHKLSSRLGNKGFEPLAGNDFVLLQDGEEHRASRKMILPVFHRQAIASYFDTMQELTTAAVADWDKRGNFHLNDEMRKLTLSIVVKTILGSKDIAEIDRVSEWFNTAVAGLRTVINWDLPFTTYGKGQAAKRKLVEYARQLIQERQAAGNLENSKDLLGLLMNIQGEDGKPFFSETQLINQAIGFLFAGHETSASLLNWLIFELGNRPEWREKLRDELQQVTGGEALKIEHLRQLTQMSHVLKEGERLYPPAFGISRGVVEDIEYGGYQIPAGWYVFIFPMLTHFMPELYPEPDTFNPDRFAPPREEDKQHPFALIGFGGGVHSCLGVEFALMEMKIILATLLQKYDWQATPTTAEISPVRQPFMMQKKLQAQFFRN